MLRRFACALIPLVVVVALSTSANAATLYAPQYSFPADKINAFSARDGVLSELSGSPFTVGPSPASGIGSISFTPDGTRAAVAFYFGGGIQGLNVDTAGALSPAQPTVGSHKGGSVAISPDGKIAYQAIAGGVKGVDAYSIGADGKLTALAGSPFDSGNDYGGVVVAQDGKHLYATVAGAIRPFSIAADGSLTAMPAHVFSGVDQLELAPNGKFLFASTYTSDAIGSFAIAADGSLAPAGPTVPVGSTSLGFFAVAPDGGRVYAIDYNGDTLGGSNYSVNTYAVSATGALSFVRAQSTLPARPHTVAVAPDGKYLYIGSNDDSKILAARIGADGSPQAFVAVGIWQSGEPEPFVFRPTQAPIAKFNASPTDKPLVMQFNPTSTTLTSNSNTLDWSYGDGKTFKGTTRATNDHKYAKPGVYNVTLAAASDGCSTAFISTGRSAICNGAPTATTTVKVDTPPWITKLKVSKKTFKLGKSTKVSYKVTEKAYVDMFAQRPAKGRMQSGECRKPSAKNKKGKKCTRWARATQTIPSSGRRTSGSFKFTGRVAASKIGPGKYRLIARAFDKAGGKSPPVTVKFKIKR